MQGKIFINDREIQYKLKRYRKSKNIKISVTNGPSDEMGCEANSNVIVLVTLPYGVEQFLIDKLLKEKSDWILAKIDQFKKNKTANQKLGKADYLKNKEIARQIITTRVKYFTRLYGFKIDKIAIRSQKTRWGSCSKDGNLNFNYKLIYLTPEMMDYVIVHELCHTDQFNHSKKFWFLVSEIIPNYKEIRKELKKINI